jgi:hypothetical protein
MTYDRADQFGMGHALSLGRAGSRNHDGPMLTQIIPGRPQLSTQTNVLLYSSEGFRLHG